MKNISKIIRNDLFSGLAKRLLLFDDLYIDLDCDLFFKIKIEADDAFRFLYIINLNQKFMR